MSEWEDDPSDSSYSESDIERDNAVYDAQQILERSYNLQCMDSLGRGTYGDVLRMVDLKSKNQKAAKIVISSNIVDLEKSIWPKLYHENILHVEKLLQMPDKTMVFITPIKYKAMHDIIFSKPFQECYQQNHKALKCWLKDTLTGMDYLHSNNFCHLDLKLDNILVGHDGRACVCDFSFINYHLKPLPVDDIGLPEVYRPPESFKKEGKKAMDGIAVDLWAYGIIILESYTDQFLIDNVDECDSWEKDVRPILEAGLEDDTFYSLVQHTFPNYPFKKFELVDLLEFVDLFLQLHPKNRVYARDALSHRFFENASNFVVVLSDIFPIPEPNATCNDVESQHVTKEVATNPPQVAKIQQGQFGKGYAAKMSAVKKKSHLGTTNAKRFIKAKRRMRIAEKRKYKLIFKNRTFRNLFMPLGNLHNGAILNPENSDSKKNTETEISSAINLLLAVEEKKVEPKKKRLKKKIVSRPIVVTYLGEFPLNSRCPEISENSVALKNDNVHQPHGVKAEDSTQPTEDSVVEETMAVQEVKVGSVEELIESGGEEWTFYFWLREKWNACSRIIRRICFCAKYKD